MPVTANEILHAGGERKLLQEKQRKETLRRVELLDNRYVVKTYFIPPNARRYRKPWLREHQALTHLSDCGFPISYGYVETQRDQMRVVEHVRGYNPGTPVDSLLPEHIPALIKLYCLVHRRGVICNDSHVSNFILGAGRTLQYIDFGRARFFHCRGLFFFLFIGREFERLEREGFRNHASLIADFRTGYQQQCGWNRFQKGMINCFWLLSRCTRTLRKGKAASS